MTNFLCFVIALHVVSYANLYVIKNLILKFENDNASWIIEQDPVVQSIVSLTGSLRGQLVKC